MTAKLDMSTRLKMMNHYELRTSQKSMEFKNNLGEFKLVIGKKASKRYQVVVGEGLTPIQVFGAVIAQV